MKRVTQELYPEGADYDRAEMWAGLRPMTPTNLPLFGRRGFGNLYLNTGHGHIGWTMSHGSAQNRRRPDRRPHAGNPDGRADGLRRSRRCRSPPLARPPPDRSTSACSPVELDGGLAARAAIGLVVLATDQTLEHEFRALIRIPGVAFYESRVFNDNDITPETLRAIGPRIAPSARSHPAQRQARRRRLRLHFGDDDARRGGGVRRNPQGRARASPARRRSPRRFAAFRALGAQADRPADALFAPRSTTTSSRYFEGRGVDVAAVATFDRQDDREAARISLASIEAGARRLAQAPGVECDVRLLHQPARRRDRRARRGRDRRSGHLEQPRDGVALPAAGGVADRVPGAGRLFELGLA